MANEGLVFYILAFLALTVAFNSLLLLRLVKIVGRNEYLRSPLTLPVGSPLPEFSGKRLLDDSRFLPEACSGQPGVLLFFSPGCDDCKARVREVSDMYPAIRRSGVGLWIIGSISKKRFADFLRGTPLLEHVVIVGGAALRELNPKGSVPFYIFIDEHRTVLASNFVGDDDWRSFCEQMREFEREAGSRN